MIGRAIVALGVLGAASAIGTPHVLHEAVCQTFDRRSCTKVIEACVYYGIQGRRTIIPHWEPDQPQSCPEVVFLPLRWPPFQWNGAGAG